MPVTYKRNENNPYGRSNPEKALGLFPIRREIRHTLASGEMVDLDVKNCHPEMLLQLCHAENYDCPELSDYVNNRQVYFDKGTKAYGCSNDEIKRLFIIYLYGGGFDNWAEDLDVSQCDSSVVSGFIVELESFEQFRKSIAPIHRLIAEKNPDLCRIVTDIKLEKGMYQYNLKATVCSFVLQEYEIRVLEQLFIYCSDNSLIKKKVCVLCADGMMIERRFYKPDLLDKFATIVRDIIGFKLTFTQKDMNQGYESILDDNLITMPSADVAKETITGVLDSDDSGAADVVLKHYPHWKCCNNTLYVFDDTTGMWSDSVDVQNRIITSLSK